MLNFLAQSLPHWPHEPLQLVTGPAHQQVSKFQSPSQQDVSPLLPFFVSQHRENVYELDQHDFLPSHLHATLLVMLPLLHLGCAPLST